ncbi:MAG: hypothetical protein JRN16_08865 [Nitrososphaerota archaeon]|nr:hypothetical protein [Nitrososphaerota archaeon]MDG7019980.1 hypothetical protein [Nitrososphaerota archaeon]MDG7028505.1 hypothetical protein [Nitrososphaerota archaeon]
MASKTITVNVRADVEEKFRRVAASTHGTKKGYLGRALTEAMEKWAREKEEGDAVVQTLGILDQGLELKGLRYRRREELHER